VYGYFFFYKFIYNFSERASFVVWKFRIPLNETLCG
jgi:hypothetical protein